MTVKELIQELSKFDGDTEVQFEYSYDKCCQQDHDDYFCEMPDVDERRTVNSVELKTHSVAGYVSYRRTANKLKKPIVLLKGDRVY